MASRAEKWHLLSGNGRAEDKSLPHRRAQLSEFFDLVPSLYPLCNGFNIQSLPNCSECRHNGLIVHICAKAADERPIYF
jgi:hypothetical protein